MAFDHEFRGSPPSEANEKGCSGDGRDLPGEFFECDACTEMRPVEGSETVTVFVHRIEGRAVGRDLETICAACVAQAQYYDEK